MGYDILFSDLMKLINPLSLIPDFYERTYILFFVLSAGLFLYYFFSNKKLIQNIRNLYNKTNTIAKILLFLLILLHIANGIYSMQPLNNLQPPNLHEIYEANEFKTEFSLTRLIQPSGFPIFAAFFKTIFDLDYIYIYSLLGILFSSLTIILLFLILKQLINNDFISLIAALIYISMSYVVFYSTTYVGPLVASSFLVSVLIFLYMVDKKTDATKTILYCSLFLTYFRIETGIFLIIFFAYLIITKSLKKLGIIDYILTYILLMPHLLPTLTRDFSNQSQSILGLEGFYIKFLSFLNIFQELNLFFAFLFVAGIIYSIYRKKWVFLSLFAGILLIYSSFRVYDAILPRYFFNIIPFILVFIAYGAYYIHSKLKNKNLGYVFLSLTVIIALFGINSNFFSKFPVNDFFIEPHINFGDSLKNNKLILMGSDFFTYQGFYHDYCLYIRKGDCNAEDHDFVVIFLETELELDYYEGILDRELELYDNSNFVYILELKDDNPKI